MTDMQETGTARGNGEVVEASDLMTRIRQLWEPTDAEMLALAKRILRESGERPLSLSEIATLLHQKKSNVAKFLVRREVEPAFEKAAGYFWWESDIQRVKAAREADTARMAADGKRRAAAIRRRDGVPAPPVDMPKNLGRSQRVVLTELLRRPLVNPDDTQRLALRRLRERGLVASTRDGDLVVYVLTDEGRRVAAEIRL